MRPNLARFRATSLDFCFDLRLDRGELEQLTSAFRDDERYRDFPWFFADSYSAGRARQVASLLVMGAAADATVIHVHFEFSRRPPLPADLKVRPLSDFLGLIFEQDVKRTFDCTVTLEYPEKGWESLVPLPMRMVEYSDLPFDEFRGVRAVKIEGDRTAYSIIIDRAENKAISHVVRFSHSGQLHAKLADTILKEGSRISSLFIRRAEE